MHRSLLSFAQTLLIEPRCPICDGPWDSPLPQRMALGLGRPTAELLHRTHAGLSQHHLNRHQRQTNLIGAFRAFPMEQQGAHSSVWLVDDILTTGSTCLLYTSPSPRDKRQSRMPSSA